MDTVRITIKLPTKLTVTNSPFTSIYANKRGFPQAWLNGKDYYNEYGLYFPTVSYMERPNGKRGAGVSYDLRIEFSAPKLLFGNNLLEVAENNYLDLRTTLLSRLWLMGFDFITPGTIDNATISRLDVCKNIIFDNRTETTVIIRTINNVCLGGAFTPFEKRYLGGGYAVGFSLKNEMVSFYDKGEDIKRARNSESKAQDEDAFFEGNIGGEWRNCSILRFEVKMGNTGTIRRRMKSAGLNTGNKIITFKGIFKENIWRGLLNYRFEQIYSKIPKTELDDESIGQIFLNIAREEQGKRGGLRRSLERIGAYCLEKYSGLSAAEVNSTIERAFGRNNKYKLHRIRDAPVKEGQLKALVQLRKSISDYKPLTMGEISKLS